MILKQERIEPKLAAFVVPDNVDKLELLDFLRDSVYTEDEIGEFNFYHKSSLAREFRERTEVNSLYKYVSSKKHVTLRSFVMAMLGVGSTDESATRLNVASGVC